MSLVKYAGVSLIAMSASMANAGGMEATALSAGFMFEEGRYGSVSVQSQSPSVKAKTAGGVSVTSGSLIGSVSSTNLKAKMDVLDNMSVGISYYRQAGIKLDYPANWTTASGLTAGQIATMPKVDLDVMALALIAKYDVNENVSAQPRRGVSKRLREWAARSRSRLGSPSAVARPSRPVTCQGSNDDPPTPPSS